MKKRFHFIVGSLTLSLLLCISFTGYTQYGMRQVVIYRDTVVEFQKHSDDDPNIPYGIDIHMSDSTNKTVIELIRTVKNNAHHGDTYFFDPLTGLPSSKEHYENDLQDGTSYYWNRRGELIRTELWKRGKLIAKKVYKK